MRLLCSGAWLILCLMLMNIQVRSDEYSEGTSGEEEEDAGDVTQLADHRTRHRHRNHQQQQPAGESAIDRQQWINRQRLVLLGLVAICTAIAAFSRPTFPVTICRSVCL